MNDEQILEYGVLCATFLGSELKTDGIFSYWEFDSINVDKKYINGSSWVSGNFEFHTNWNWIMLVLNEIEIRGYRVTINNNPDNIIDDNITALLYSENKKTAIVQSIYEFLKTKCEV